MDNIEEAIIWIEENKCYITERALRGNKPAQYIIENYIIFCHPRRFELGTLAENFLLASIRNYIDENEKSFEKLLK